MADCERQMISFQKCAELIKSTVLDNLVYGEFGPHISADGHAALLDQVEKIYRAGVREALDDELREKVRQQLANDPHCYD
jgi:hypothetical protein